ncbi:hypothetical protein [Niallia nealsonii]|uniref:hypothetical protein n=1 Tax=Niallia nealsonii TaxID=115979 RepID=UPI0012FF4EFC|nr:hypothetical protein [Niallia nealsonii]
MNQNSNRSVDITKFINKNRKDFEERLLKEAVNSASKINYFNNVDFDRKDETKIY